MAPHAHLVVAAREEVDELQRVVALLDQLAHLRLRGRDALDLLLLEVGRALLVRIGLGLGLGLGLG